MAFCECRLKILGFSPGLLGTNSATQLVGFKVHLDYKYHTWLQIQTHLSQCMWPFLHNHKAKALYNNCDSSELNFVTLLPCPPIPLRTSHPQNLTQLVLTRRLHHQPSPVTLISRLAHLVLLTLLNCHGRRSPIKRMVGQTTLLIGWWTMSMTIFTSFLIMCRMPLQGRRLKTGKSSNMVYYHKIAVAVFTNDSDKKGNYA